MSDEPKYKPRLDPPPEVPWYYPFESPDHPTLKMTPEEFSAHIKARYKIYEETHCRHAKLLADGCWQCDEAKKKALTPR
jgi:hypothetical protein